MKKGNVISFIAGFLTWPALVLVITLVGVVVRKINSSPSVVAVPISAEYGSGKNYDWYSSLGIIKTCTADKNSTVQVDIALAYKEGDKKTATEIAQRTVEMKDYLRRYFFAKSAEELKTQNEEKFRTEIKDDINDKILSSSKILDIKFIQFDVRENSEIQNSKNSETATTAISENKNSSTSESIANSSFPEEKIDNIFDVAKTSSKNQMVAYLEKAGFESYYKRGDGELFYQPKEGRNITFYGMKMNAIILQYIYNDTDFTLMTVSVKKEDWIKLQALVEDAEKRIINRYGFAYSEKSDTYKNGKYGFSVSENLNDITFVFSNW